MLNGSLVCYSDSDNSEREVETWTPKTGKKILATSPKKENIKFCKKPEQQLYVPPRGRSSGNSLSPPSQSPNIERDNVFSGGKEKILQERDSSKSNRTVVQKYQMSFPKWQTYTQRDVSLEDIPLPEDPPPEAWETTPTKTPPENKKSKQIAKPLYVPPQRRHSTPTTMNTSLKEDSVNPPESNSSVITTPKSRKSSSEGEILKSGSGRKRKCTSPPKSLDVSKCDTKHARKKRLSYNSDEDSTEKSPPEVKEVKTVTLKPFWAFCPPTKRSVVCSKKKTSEYRDNSLSESPQPLSLPCEPSSPSTPDYSPVNSGPSSLPEWSTYKSKADTSSSSLRLCSISDYNSDSSLDASPSTSLSCLELTNSDSPKINRRHSQGAAIPSLQRSRINSLDSSLRRRIYEGSRTSPNSSYNFSAQNSYWMKNFRQRFCNYTNPYIDSHCHLDFLYKREGFRGTFQKYKDVHQLTFPSNFAGCVAVFCEPRSFNPNYGLWRDVSVESDVWVAMGCHPKCSEDYTGRAEDGLIGCLSQPKVIAAGEFGLDYSGRFSETADKQKDVFVRQLKIAISMDKPLVIHCRKAEQDTFDIMEKYVPKHTRIHRHCFTEDFNEASRWLNTFPNLFMGLTPLVTYKSAVETHDVAQKIPLDRLLLETDAPYFVPYSIPRSEMSLSHPGMAITVAEKVAFYKNIPVTQIIDATRENTKKMYGI